MVRRKIDNRIRVLIENCVITGHRSFFVIVGEKARDNVVILHEMLSKAEVKARPSVLWCYKDNLGFNTNKKKRQKLRKAQSIEGKQQFDADDPLEYFIASTNIRYCYYRETHSILGQTFGMAILQDFEALTPNLLARTIETVSGGGIIIILLQTLKSLKQLYTMTMDVHARYRTEAYQDIVCRFNERFILSLPTCSDCLVVDDKLTILPISSNVLNINPLPPKSMDSEKSTEELKLIELKSSIDPKEPINGLVKLCKTFDQGKAVLQFINSLSEIALRSTITLTSARGRGKSAALGLAVAGAIAFRYTNIVIAAPHAENVQTLFKFLALGLNELGYEKSTDYEEVRSTEPEYNKAVVQVTVKKHHQQTVRYYDPSCGMKLGLVELVVIDEAAAIPLPFVQRLLGPYLVFMASTINGYEGTGRSLSLKLISQLRKETVNKDSDEHSQRNSTGRTLHEITLNESIRYRNGDQVEDWLNRLLCLDVAVPAPKLADSLPASDCKLYYVNRDTLFSYNKFAEKFLRKLVAILVASHYKNSPNDLLVMSDAPAHHIFCLCAPSSSKKLPEIMCVLQVCFEGKLSEGTVREELKRGKRGHGDLVPWVITQEYSEENFFSLSGARIVRIATHPKYQKKGYGSYAIKLLQDFYEGKFISDRTDAVNMTPMVVEDDDEAITSLLEERLEPRTSLPPLLYELDQVKPEILDYLSVSYGVTLDLLRFWKKAGFCPAYLAHSPSQITGEHTCIMLKQLSGLTTSSSWLVRFWHDFCHSMVYSFPIPQLSPEVSLELICNSSMPASDKELLFLELSEKEVLHSLGSLNIVMLKKIFKTLTSHPPIFIVSALARFYFTHRLQVSLDENERIVLFSIGVLYQCHSEVCKHLNMNIEQVKKTLQEAIIKMAAVVLEKLQPFYENECKYL